ncbi:MAG: GNAT family N-acetyltransferase [Pirellulales bacterium]
MRVIRIGNFQQWQALAPQWEALTPRHPLLTPAWLEPWWRHYGPTTSDSSARQELYLLAVRDDDGRLAGVAPWYVERSRCRGAIVRFLGAGEVCSDDLTLPCRPGLESKVARAVADWMLPQPNGSARSPRPTEDRWNLLALSGIDRQDPTMTHFFDACRQRGAIVHRRQTHNCWTIDLPDCWEAYVSGLSKSHRKRVRRLDRVYFQSGRVRRQEANDGASLDRGFSILVNLHSKRWQIRDQPGVFAATRFAAFHQDVARAMLDHGWLRLSWLELEGRPIAAEYQFARDRGVYAYQSGMDPEMADHQPGNLSMMATVHHSIERGERSIDLMRGDEPYKAHWRARPRPSVELRILPPQPTNHLRQQIWLARESGKQWLRTATRRDGHAPNEITTKPG